MTDSDLAAVREALTWSLDEHDYGGTENPPVYFREALVALDRLAGRITALKNLQQFRVDSTWKDRAEAAEAELVEERKWIENAAIINQGLNAKITVLRGALEQIIAEYDVAQCDADAFEDNGGHVGIARHDRAVLQGLATARDIARAALDIAQEEV